MKTAVTMKTKGVTQDKDGNYGIWRTIKRVGKVFIRVGETGEDAVARYTKELLSMPISKLKKKAQKPKNKNKMAEQEFAIWLRKVGEAKRGTHFYKNSKGDMYIPIGAMIVVTGGPYENPIAENVLRFTNEDTVYEWLKVRGNKNGK